MRQIEVTRSIHIEYSYPSEKTPASMTYQGTYVRVRASEYVSVEKPVLLQCVCRDWKHYFQRSTDNGKTWRRCGEWYNDDAWDKPEVWDPAYDKASATKGSFPIFFAPVFFFDRAENLVLRVYIQGETCPAEDGGMFGGTSTYRLMYQISPDEGLTWSQPKQIIQKGSEYNEKHWARGIDVGKKGGMIAVTPFLKLDNGEICIPFVSIGPGNNFLVEEASCLLAKWNSGKTGLDVEMGEYVTLDRKLSACGADEPSVAKLSDGRLFMILRADKSDVTNLPGLKYYALSEDNARTWSYPKVLAWPDGSVIYSPCCMAHALCSSKNRRLYIITTLHDHAFSQVALRNPLQIAEVDQKTFCVIPETVTIIEDMKPKKANFSNWCYHEDRETGDVILYMTPCGTGQGGYYAPDCGVPFHSFKYNIRLPE